MRKKIFLGVLVLFASSFAAAAEGYAWDYLRPVADFALSIDLPVKIVVFLLSLFVFAISFLSYYKSRSKRILLVSVAFLLFSLKWLVKIVDLVYSPGTFLSDSSENLFELGIILSLLVALFYRGEKKDFFSRRGKK